MSDRRTRGLQFARRRLIQESGGAGRIADIDQVAEGDRDKCEASHQSRRGAATHDDHQETAVLSK